ncbi:MAG: hypothetical protein ACYTFW_03550 [Planctomycetota bacterium]|jgi:hypothetical protein
MEAAKKQSQFKAKQSQFANGGPATSILGGKQRFAEKLSAKNPVFCIFLEKFDNSALKCLGICTTDATITGCFVDNQIGYFDLRIRNNENYAHYKSVS